MYSFQWKLDEGIHRIQNNFDSTKRLSVLEKSHMSMFCILRKSYNLSYKYWSYIVFTDANEM